MRGENVKEGHQVLGRLPIITMPFIFNIFVLTKYSLADSFCLDEVYDSLYIIMKN